MYKGTILYVGNFELPDKGASANRVMTNRLLFHECGYRTVYLGVTREERFEGIRQSSFDNDVYERAYPTSTKMWLAQIYSLKDIMGVVERYDDVVAILFYNVPISLVARAYYTFHKKNICVLYDCTEWNGDTAGSLLKRTYKKIDEYLIRNRLVNYVDGLIVISTLMYRQYKGKPIILLPPLVDIDAPVWCGKRTRNDGIFEFSYAGFPERKDDLCKLIKAFAEIDCEKTRLTIMGVAKDDFLQDNPNCLPELERLGERLIFTGCIPHQQVISRLINTDCFVFIREPNLRNNAGFPTKFAEAATVNIPIIATDISDIKSYLGVSVDGYILESTDKDSIYSALHKVLLQNQENHKKHELSERQLLNLFDYRAYQEEFNNWMKRFIHE